MRRRSDPAWKAPTDASRRAAHRASIAPDPSTATTVSGCASSRRGYLRPFPSSVADRVLEPCGKRGGPNGAHRGDRHRPAGARIAL